MGIKLVIILVQANWVKLVHDNKSHSNKIKNRDNMNITKKRNVVAILAKFSD